jgi:hypothetical protein
MKILDNLRQSGVPLAQIAKSIGTSPSYLSQMVHGRKPWAPQYCAAIERLTAGAVTRQALRPHDYWRIWPDLPAPDLPAPDLPALDLPALDLPVPEKASAPMPSEMGKLP